MMLKMRVMVVQEMDVVFAEAVNVSIPLEGGIGMAIIVKSRMNVNWTSIVVSMESVWIRVVSLLLTSNAIAERGTLDLKADQSETAKWQSELVLGSRI